MSEWLAFIQSLSNNRLVNDVKPCRLCCSTDLEWDFFLSFFGNGLLNWNLSRPMLQHCPLNNNQNNFRNVSFFMMYLYII